MNLITLEEAKAQLMMDHDEDDALIQSQIVAASGAVLNYLKGAPIGQPERDEQGAIVKDSGGNVVYEYDSEGLVVRYEVKAAVKLLVGEFYRYRDAEQEGAVDSKWGYGYLPRPVVALLTPLRDPALA